ncbi:unnamed protein product [Phytophthora lilii]|uniref:Unnamed protein product n=1 Tax=Phytophthora lilii TaxID=2077276 RepID=A0A9W6UBA9_9STRA|nr:unnamed protein product [Phytophthora lilii]
MVETQGRGTLHLHILIWLDNCPTNSTALTKLLDSPDGDIFRERIVSNADSIVRNDLPIALDEHGCSSCGATFQELVGLPIPDEARKEPLSSTRETRSRGKATEPALVQCRRCSTQFSSQHLIRNALLKARPAHWPVWQHSMSKHEVEEQANRESACRNTKRHAVNVVCDRESVQDSFCSEDSIRDNDMLITGLLYQANHRQMPLCKADDDFEMTL